MDSPFWSSAEEGGVMFARCKAGQEGTPDACNVLEATRLICLLSLQSLHPARGPAMNSTCK